MKIHLKTVDLAELAGFEPAYTKVKALCVYRFTTTQKQSHIFGATHLTLRLDFLREICVAIFTSTPQMICIYNSYFQYEIISLSNSFY